MNLLKKHAKRRCRIIAFFFFAFQLLWVNPSFTYASAPFNDTRQNPVTGVVTEENGTPLPGVSIIQKGTTNGTVTDADGKYTVEAPQGSTLVFSFIGFTTKEVTVNTEVINVVLEESVVNLDEVVAIGYGKLKSSQVSSSISKVSSEDITERAVARIDQAIQGKIAGVQVQEVSGSPGASLNVKVRGVGSINYSSNPLYVVDGFPISGDLNSINPGDIESIEVLKDAASAAIYGSRGSNGVILITTKGGTAGKNTIEIDAFYGLQERFSKIDVLNRDEYIEYAIEERINSYAYSGSDLSVPESERHNYKYAIDPLWRTNPESFPDNDWQDLIDRVAPVQSYSLSASGGNDKTRYFIASNFYDQNGIILNSFYKRYTARANVQTQLKDWVAMGMNLSVANSRRNDPDTDTNGGPISRSILMAPIVGVDQQTVAGGNYYYHAHFYLNPIAMAEEIVNETKRNDVMSNFYAEFIPVKNLVFKASVGANINSDKNQYFKPNNINRGNGSFGSVTNRLIQNYLSENTVTYDLSRDNWTLNLLGGFTYQEENYEYSYLKKSGFPDEEIQTLNAGTQLDSGTSTESKWSLISYLARANFSYRNKYVATASIRRDGCSRFGKDNRWGIFPSASLGWILSEESFMQSIKKEVSNLKLRASFGTVGNNNIGNYSAIALLSSANYIVGDMKEGGYQPASFGNKDLGWEMVSTADVGLDMGFLNNRINLTLDYYVANTRDLLLNVPVPQITGFNSALQNIGKVQNKGYEVELLTKNVVGTFKWTTAFNISHNKNEVKELGPDGSPIITNIYQEVKTITQIGGEIGEYYLYETDGIFKDQADVDANGALAYRNKKPQPGDLKYKDQTNDGEITEEDKIPMGNNQPDFIWGLTNTFSYKGIGLSIFMDGQTGNYLLNVAKGQNSQSRANVRGEWRDRWRSAENPGNGKVPRAVTTDNLTTPSDWFLEDASFWRIRNINLSYQVPQKVVNKLKGIGALKIYGSVENVYMYDHYNHMSQTATFSNSNTLQGMDFDSGYPLARTYRIGLNLKF
ncbi:SusC/RagA family TonB-linked outer membrane protein [Mariniphaga sediminis]|nr:TonB-dependent receptor [Mariniphaga sediminis]